MVTVLALPVNPFPPQETLGKDYLLYVNTGTVTVPVWTLVGGQRDSSLNRKSTSTVGNNIGSPWTTVTPGLLSWSVDLSGLVMLNDAGCNALEAAFVAQVDVEIKFLYPSLQYRTGNVLVTEFSIDNPHDGEAVLKGTLIGDGALSALLGP